MLPPQATTAASGGLPAAWRAARCWRWSTEGAHDVVVVGRGDGVGIEVHAAAPPSNFFQQ